MGEHGAVFGGPWLELDEFREARLRTAPEGKERRVFMYRQEMDGLPVVGSSFRVMTLGEPDSGPARVVYAAGRVAIRPEGGLPEPTVTPAQALQAAKAHHKGREMVSWSEAELVAIYDDAPRGDAVAYPVWKYIGEGETLLDSYTFYVDALAGEVARYESNVMHFSDEITGKVEGNATPARHGTSPDPDLFGPDTWTGTATDCPNPPELQAMRAVRVVAYLTGTETFVADAWTNADGTYTLDVPEFTTVDVYALLTGPGWDVSEPGNPPSPVQPLKFPDPVTSPAGDVDLTFNASPSEFGTAQVNSHAQVEKTWRFLDLDDTDPLPQLPVVANFPAHSSVLWFGAYFQTTETIYLRDSIINSVSGERANGAFSTVISHEFGHFIMHKLLDNSGGLFDEAFADVVAHLTHDTAVIGQDGYGCGNHVHEPWVTDPEYPVCDTDPNIRLQLLSAIWLDIRIALGAETTRQLFLDWMMIAQRPGDFSCGSPINDDLSQSADDGTLVEVLGVADPDLAPTICEVFQVKRNIGVGHPSCPDSAGGRVYADCDGDGRLTFLDFLCFQNAFIAGDPYADCDGDGRHSFFDFLCFQNEFLAASR